MKSLGVETASQANLRLEKARDYCHERLAVIHGDDRFASKAADVFINAPLALIQCDLEGREQELTKILAILEKGLL